MILQSFLDAYFYCVLRRPLWTLVVILLIALGLSSNLSNLKIDASSDALLLEYDADLDYFREISKRYGSGDFLVVTYKPEGKLLSTETLVHLRTLRDELVSIDGIDSANSILDVPLLYSPPVTFVGVSRGIKTLSDGGFDFDLVEKEFLESPIYKNMLLGPDKKTTAILLNLTIDEAFIELVRTRDALRLKRDTEGLTEQEVEELATVSAEFLDYSTEATARSHQRVNEVREVIGKYKGDAQIFLGGVSMITADMVDFIRSDIGVFGVGIIVFIVIILSIIFRQWQFVLLPLTTCLLTLIIMLGFLATVDWRLTVISSNFVALLLIICIAITIHLIVRYRELSKGSDLTEPKERSNYLKQTVQAMFLPCTYTVLTTLVAFISLVVSGIRPVIDFGWMMSIGLCLAFLMAFLIIPAGLMVLPATHSNTGDDKSSVITLVFSKFTERQGSLIIFLGVVASVISVLGMMQLKVENRFIDYFHSSTEIYQGMEIIDQQLGGTITLDITLDHRRETESEEDDAFVNEGENDFEGEDFGGSDPFSSEEGFADEFEDDAFADDSFDDEFSDENPFGDSEEVSSSASSSLPLIPITENFWFTQEGMEKIESVHDYLDGLSEVGKVQSLAIAYKVARDLNGRSLNNFELALMAKALPKDINDFLIWPYLATDKEQTRITMRIRETDPDLRRNELLKTIRTDLVEKFDLAEDDVRLTGVLVLYNNLLQSLFQSQILTLGAVFVGILIMFLVLFRSLVLSLIALIPNMLAALVVLGGMGLVGIPLDMMTITIAAIAVGIGVDNAIHYIYRYRNEFAKEKNYIQSMHNAHASIGQAMFFTSVTIIVGFSILALSKFIPSIYFGLLTGLAMLAAILASLTLLPKLILLLKPLGGEDVTSST